MVGTFSKMLKAELVWRVAFQSRAEATIAIGRYIDGFYNHVRRHSALDFIRPLQLERLAAQNKSALHFVGASPFCPRSVRTESCETFTATICSVDAGPATMARQRRNTTTASAPAITKMVIFDSLIGVSSAHFETDHHSGRPVL